MFSNNLFISRTLNKTDCCICRRGSKVDQILLSTIFQGNITNGLFNGNFTYGGVCPPGYYCPEGTNRAYNNYCPNGTYNAYPGAKSRVEGCKRCDPGRVCNGQGLTEPNGFCRPGWYCSGGATTSMPNDGRTGDQCTQGHYCPNGTR